MLRGGFARFIDAGQAGSKLPEKQGRKAGFGLIPRAPTRYPFAESKNQTRAE